MAQWVNCLWNNIFVNPPPLSLFCEISGALHLAQPGLTAGKQAGWQTKYRLISKISKLAVQYHYSLTKAFYWVFQIKPVVRFIFKV